MYQRPASAPDTSVVSSISSSFPSPSYSSSFSSSSVKSFLGKGKHYNDFLAFFQNEMASPLGLEGTIRKHLFSHSPTADDLLLRVHAGFLHPLIHLMYGFEFQQPAIVAQALAQAAVHERTLGEYLVEVEEKAASVASSDGFGHKDRWKLADLYAAVHNDPALAGAAHWDDDQKLSGVLTRARHAIVDIAARVRIVEEDGLEEIRRRTTEMHGMALRMTLGSATCMRHRFPEKGDKIDFFLMHHANSAPFYVALAQEEDSPKTWMNKKAKARLLEWKIRLDLIQYAARGAPKICMPSEAGRQEKGIQEDDALEKLHALKDDGHAIKLARSMALYRKCAHGKGVEGLRTNEDWEMAFGMLVESVSREGEPKWVRSVGMEGAWEVRALLLFMPFDLSSVLFVKDAIC